MKSKPVKKASAKRSQPSAGEVNIAEGEVITWWQADVNLRSTNLRRYLDELDDVQNHRKVIELSNARMAKASERQAAAFERIAAALETRGWPHSQIHSAGNAHTHDCGCLTGARPDKLKRDGE